MLLVIVKEKKLLECFTKNNYKKNQKEFRIEKAIKKKDDKLYVNCYDSSFNSQIDNGWIDIVQKSEYFPELKSSGGKVNFQLDLSNYATKSDLKNATSGDTSFAKKFHTKFPKKVDLANLKSNVDTLDIDQMKNVPSGLNSLKSKVDNLDIDKLIPAPVTLSKPSDVVKNNVVKKDKK